MKKTIITLFTIAALLLSASVMAQTAKIGYINSEKIIAAYKPAIDAQQKLIGLRDAIQQEMQNMQQEIINTQEQLKTQSMMLTSYC